MTTKLTFTFAELDVQIALDCPDCIDADDFKPGEYTEYMLSEMHDDTATMINHYGITWDTDTMILEFELRDFAGGDNRKNQFEGLGAFFDFIHNDYDSALGQWCPLLSYLSGDDDVDYNASYPSIVVDALSTLLDVLIPPIK